MSFNDYLTYVLPICYGVLNLTGDEIGRLTPYEINMRIKGYEERLKQQRLFYANFVTVPIINAAGHPKHPVTVKKLLPNDFSQDIHVSKKQAEGLLKFAEEQERRRNNVPT